MCVRPCFRGDDAESPASGRSEYLPNLRAGGIRPCSRRGGAESAASGAPSHNHALHTDTEGSRFLQRKRKNPASLRAGELCVTRQPFLNIILGINKYSFYCLFVLQILEKSMSLWQFKEKNRHMWDILFLN